MKYEDFCKNQANAVRPMFQFEKISETKTLVKTQYFFHSTGEKIEFIWYHSSDNQGVIPKQSFYNDNLISKGIVFKKLNPDIHEKKGYNMKEVKNAYFNFFQKVKRSCKKFKAVSFNKQIEKEFNEVDFSHSIREMTHLLIKVDTLVMHTYDIQEQARYKYY